MAFEPEQQSTGLRRLAENWRLFDRAQRVNVVLYGLGALSLLMLLFEVVAGDNPPTQVDLASRPATTRAAPPAPTTSTFPATSTSSSSTIAPPTTVSPASTPTTLRTTTTRRPTPTTVEEENDDHHRRAHDVDHPGVHHDDLRRHRPGTLTAPRPVLIGRHLSVGS